MEEVAKPFNDDDLLTDKISKKDLVVFLQENASSQVNRTCIKLVPIFKFYCVNHSLLLIL